MSTIYTDSIEQAASVIASGGVIVCPSEGVYGISCSVFNEAAVKRIIAIKHRSSTKGLIIVDSSLEYLKEYLDESRVDDKAMALMNGMWPGPHTFVVPVVDSFKNAAVRDDHSAGVRISAFRPFAQICSLARTPIVSTSANISGESATTELDSIDPRVTDNVDLVLTLPCGGLSSSTSIYNTLTHSLIRQGPMWEEKLAKIL
ncbi:L-threonylcarbamoyladenylate synthase [Succinivibrio dextrinosolvens]|uniref:L-threonylcarbamoyladenylate synthase n=1 Tax=Succinivibrio dextrinosolvens TaxID=83771 RepID=UPI0008E7F735|nr:L-threonylcarbamoyladenylate synthase [Succinivibrio dextrinosolvens]SFS50260.1 L-threonylcarbamoyladenylate synthase [Succinivibrio dextrinosolvens]